MMINCNCTSCFRHCKNSINAHLSSFYACLWENIRKIFWWISKQETWVQDIVRNKNPDFGVLIENYSVWRLWVPSFDFCFWLALSFMILFMTFYSIPPFLSSCLLPSCLLLSFHLWISLREEVQKTDMIYGLFLTFFRKTESEWSGTYPSSARKNIVSWDISPLRALSAWNCSACSTLHSHTIHFSYQMTLNPHFCFPPREGLTPHLIVAINILIQGPFKM